VIHVTPTGPTGWSQPVDCGLTPVGTGISLSVDSGQGGRDQTDSGELTEPMSPTRRAAALLLATGLGLGVAGCGGADPTTKGPVSKSPSSSTPTPTEASSTPAPTPTQRPLSRFENTPEVKVMRKWAVAYGKAVNAGDRSLRAVAPYSTAAGMKVFPKVGAEDFGTYFPGPQPFTPVRIRVAGGTSVVTSCLWSDGWGQDPRTKLPARKRDIIPADLVFKKEAGHWKLDTLNEGRNDCSQVPVKGIPW
jgi:hypothetical protein